jgi:hypothetical protein
MVLAGALARGMSTTTAHGLKGVVFGLSLVTTPHWAKHEPWELSKKLPAGTLQRLAARPQGAIRGMLGGMIGTTEGDACKTTRCARHCLRPS